MTLTATGLGIGTTTPLAKLNINKDFDGTGNYNSGHLTLAGSTNPQRRLNLGYDTTDNFAFIEAVEVGSASRSLSLNPGGGSVGIGTTTPADKLDVYGDIRVGTGTTGCVKDADGTTIAGTCSSDERLKKDITPLATNGKSYLAALVALEPVSYHWNDIAADTFKYGTKDLQIGLIAQQVEETMPELVVNGTAGYKQLRFSELPIYLLQALRELWTIVTGNQEKISELERRVERLEAELDGENNENFDDVLNDDIIGTDDQDSTDSPLDSNESVLSPTEEEIIEEERGDVVDPSVTKVETVGEVTE